MHSENLQIIYVCGHDYHLPTAFPLLSLAREDQPRAASVADAHAADEVDDGDLCPIVRMSATMT